MIQSSSTPLVGSYLVQKYVLKNGLKLLVVEDHSSPTFAYQTWFNVGSKDEVTGRTGLAHLFEHLMFKATTTHPEGEFDRILEGAGVEEENAFTSWDYTAYVQELPKNQLELIAKLEADRMVHLVVNEESFKTEREVVQNERRYRNENSPDGLMFQELYGLAFKKHPYHWPIIGYQEDLAAETAKDAVDFYKNFYSPNHATVVVSGDVRATEVLRLVQKHYGSMDSAVAAARPADVEAPQTLPRRKTLKLHVQVEKLLMAYPMPAIGSLDLPPLFVLDAVLTGGKSGRLQKSLLETGIVSSIDTSPMEQKDPTLFIIEGNLQKNRKARQAEKVILDEIQNLAKNEIPAEELERAKNRILFSFYQRLDGNSERANFLGRYESLTGYFEKGIELQRAIELVSAAEIKKVVSKYFQPRFRNVITGVSQ